MTSVKMPARARFVMSPVIRHLSLDLKILILKPSSLGDVIQALPVLRLLKLHFPRRGNFLVD